MSNQRTRSELDRRKIVSRWFLIVAFLILCLIMVGGATRLTDSGLSITQWKPLHGIIPPLSAKAWQEEFALYKAIPEYRLQNKGMSLSDFQFIFWWEWSHRILARTVGLALLVPAIVMAFLRQWPRGFAPKILFLLALIGFQGFVGWWMVSSGLVGDRLDVVALRLTVHFCLAATLLSAVTWMALDYAAPPQNGGKPPALPYWCALLAMIGQVVLGTIMAGTHAGLAFVDWPTIGGQWFPASYEALSPFMRNFTENLAAIQFNHRTGAIILFLAVFWAMLRARAEKVRGTYGWANFALGLVLCQFALGVYTLHQFGLTAPPQVPGVLIGVAHQGLGAVVAVTIVMMFRAATHKR